jgi:uncharacterized protein with HEPN domain
MRDEAAYLWDMHDSAQRILKYVETMTWEHFESNAPIQDAINWRLVIIGESAKGISSETRARLRIIWQTIKQDLPALVQALIHILPPRKLP